MKAEAKKTPHDTRVSVLVYPETHARLRAMATKEQRTMRIVLERAVQREMERSGLVVGDDEAA